MLMTTPKPIVMTLKPVAGLGRRRTRWTAPLLGPMPAVEPLPRPVTAMVGEGPERVAAIERVRDGYRNDPGLYREIYGSEDTGEGGRFEVYGGGY
jgi:hypothetical protein